MSFKKWLESRDPKLHKEILEENIFSNLWQGAKNVAGKALGGLKNLFGKKQQPQQAQPQAKVQPQAQPQQAQPQQAQPQQAQPQAQPKAKAQTQVQPQQQNTATTQNDTNMFNAVNKRFMDAYKKYQSSKDENDLKNLESLMQDPELNKISDQNVKNQAISINQKLYNTALSSSMNDRIKLAYNQFKTNKSDQIMKDLTNLAKHEDLIKITDDKVKNDIIKRISSYADMARTELQTNKG